MLKIVIVGAGPAGVRAAERLVRAGHRPVVIDENVAAGGQIYRRPPAELHRDPKDLYGFEAERACKLHRTFDELAGSIDYRPSTSVWSAEGRRLDVIDRDGASHLLWDRLILATGAMDRVIPIPGWDMPGVFTLGGAQVSMKYQACAIGARPVFLGTGPLLYLIAYQYMKAGVDVAAVLDTAPLSGKVRAAPTMMAGGTALLKGLYYVARLVAAGVTIRSGITPVAIDASSGQRVGVVRYTTGEGKITTIACDAVGMGFGLRSETQLADLLDVQFDFDPSLRQWLPAVDAWGRSSVEGIYLAGDGMQLAGAQAAELSGARAAEAVLHDIGQYDARRIVRSLNRRIDRWLRFRDAMASRAFPFPHQLAQQCDDSLMICRCEGIAAGAMREAVRGQGQAEINRVKAFTRVGMGRCQGRVCQTAAAEITASAAGLDISMVSRLRGQAPIKPLPMAVFREEAAQ
ncbi:FAD-dependent oxidoreductase [Mesorhizobium sp. M1312]|uniref:FAD/NAD(P)-dependent oxidoreductase n=1 Tax=unclassified Mesorhizobium TaxID=325217 RepID=UPI00333A03CD